jgi:hypothetical protein
MEVLNDPIGVWIAAILTIMAFSYLLGDNPLYRVAEHLLVGSAIAYAVVISLHSVLIPRLFSRLSEGQWLYLIPLVLGILLLAKVRPAWADFGNVPMGVMLGVGVALALGGALSGTIGPQVRATIASVNPADYPGTGWFGVLDAIVIVVGTVGTLLYFHFSVRKSDRQKENPRDGVVRIWAKIGRWTMMVAFGAIFATVTMSRVSLFVGRVQFLLGDWLHIITVP